MPPNTTKDYDYTETMTSVESDIEDWTPKNSGSKTPVNVDTYGNLNYAFPDPDPEQIQQLTESKWYIYWMQNMPGSNNSIQYENGVMTNWWEFTADWDKAISSDLGLVSKP